MRYNYTEDSNSPGRKAIAITPHATNPIYTDVPVKGVYVGVGGDITLRGVDDTVDTLWKNVPSGTYLRFRAQYVRAVGTTATNLLAIF